MIDWAAARLDYVTHYELTYADIAAKYKAHPATIWRRAAEERMDGERKTSARKLLEKAREKVVCSQSEQLVAFATPVISSSLKNSNTLCDRDWA